MPSIPTDSWPLLEGVRVLDASRVLAGPFCGQVLGDLGADVVKIERPGQGDETRTWGPPFFGPLSAYFLSCNRNKRAILLDLAEKKGRHLLDQLLARCDVLIENFRAASVEHLDLSPQKLLEQHPRLIVCSISGFGRSGPLADLPGYDFAIQALSGLMHITGPVDGPPCKVGVAVTDVLTGLYAATTILACLHARARSGHGYVIDLALLDCAVAAQVNVAQAFLTTGQVPPRQGNAHLQIVPYQAFETADSWLVLAVGNDGQWRSFCQAVNRLDWAHDSRFTTNSLRVENRAVLVPELQMLLKRQSTAKWQEVLNASGVPHAPVWDYGALFGHPQAAARHLRLTVQDREGRPLDLLGPPFHVQGTVPPTPRMPPELGQDTEAVLRDWLGMQVSGG